MRGDQSERDIGQLPEAFEYSQQGWDMREKACRRLAVGTGSPSDTLMRPATSSVTFEVGLLVGMRGGEKDLFRLGSQLCRCHSV